jgi:hypothetical protein
MAWRAYLDADQFTAAILCEQYSDEDLFVGDEEGALFASGHKFAACNTAVEASELAETLVRQMTAVVRLIDSRCSSIAYLDRVRDDSPGGVTQIFGRVEMRAFSRLTVGGPPEPIHEGLYAHADDDPDFATALELIGQAKALDAVLLYKVFELLRRSAGGTDAAFRARAGWSEDELRNFTGSLNLPAVLGDDARHAVLAGTPRRAMGLTECADALLAVVREWPSGASPVP